MTIDEYLDSEDLSMVMIGYQLLRQDEILTNKQKSLKMWSRGFYTHYTSFLKGYEWKINRGPLKGSIIAPSEPWT